MTRLEVTLTRTTNITTEDSIAEVKANIGDYISKENLAKLISALGIDETFDIQVRELDEDEEIYCLGCGDPITEIELSENGQYCEFCVGDSDEEESI